MGIVALFMKMSHFYSSVKAEVVGCTELLNLASLLSVLWVFIFAILTAPAEWRNGVRWFLQRLYAVISVICRLVLGSSLPSHSKCLAGGFFFPHSSCV